MMYRATLALALLCQAATGKLSGPIQEEPCKQTTICEAKGGTCVRKNACGPPFECVPEFCDFGEGCVCQIGEPVCRDVNLQCARAGGDCVRECSPVDGVRKCREDFCSEGLVDVGSDDCVCKMEACKDDAYGSCARRGGTCKAFDDCDPAVFACDPILCGHGNECVCEYMGPDACPQTDWCRRNGGTCVRYRLCIPSSTVACEERWCYGAFGDRCTCKFAPCPRTSKCEVRGGTCIKDCRETPGEVKCEDLCSEDGTDTNCRCEIKEDPCPQTNECQDNDGTCVPAASCVPGPDVACEPNFCGTNPDECTCEMTTPCPRTSKCKTRGGECVKDCVEIAGQVKCEDLCSEDGLDTFCKCEIKE